MPKLGNMIYATIFPNHIQFYSSAHSARRKAEIYGVDFYAFKATSIKEWRGKKSCSSAAIGNMNVSRATAEALKIIGKNPSDTDIPLRDQISATISSLKEKGELRDEDMRTGMTLLSTNSFSFFHYLDVKNQVEKENKFIDIVSRRMSRFFEQLRIQSTEMDIDFDLISGMIDEIINSEAEEWIGINAKELAENIKMTIKQIFSDNQHAPKDTAIDIYRKDIREKSVDPVTVAKVDRWRKRCEILALIKQNDQEGIPMPQKEIAKKLGVSVGAVNKIFPGVQFDWNRKKVFLVTNDTLA